MSNRQLAVDISNMPELVRMAEEVHATGRSRILRRKKKDLAVLNPLPKAPHTSRRGKLFDQGDSLWNIVGIGRSGVRDVSENKYKYLAEAYSPKK